MLNKSYILECNCPIKSSVHGNFTISISELTHPNIIISSSLAALTHKVA